MAMFLSQDELKELTGAKTNSKQRRWLNENGIAYAVGFDGKNKVLSEHVIDVLSGSKKTTTRNPKVNLRAICG